MSIEDNENTVQGPSQVSQNYEPTADEIRREAIVQAAQDAKIARLEAETARTQAQIDASNKQFGI